MSAAHHANATADRVQSKVDRASREQRELEHKVEHLSLACQAMWELVRAASNATESDLERKMLEIDLRDGIEDGKMTAIPLTCSGCSRATNSRRKACIFCGTEIPNPHQFNP